MTALFIATVYYLLVLFQFPTIPLSSGYVLAGIVAVVSIIRMMTARTSGQKADAQVLLIASLLLFLATYVLLFFDFQM